MLHDVVPILYLQTKFEMLVLESSLDCAKPNASVISSHLYGP